MKINAVAVGEKEFYKSQRISWTRLLTNRTIVPFHIVIGEVVFISFNAWQYFLSKNSGRYIPIGAKHNMFQSSGKNYCVIRCASCNYIHANIILSWLSCISFSRNRLLTVGERLYSD